MWAAASALSVGHVFVTAFLLAAVKACCVEPDVSVPTLVHPVELPHCIANPDLECCQQVCVLLGVVLPVLAAASEGMLTVWPMTPASKMVFLFVPSDARPRVASIFNGHVSAARRGRWTRSRTCTPGCELHIELISSLHELVNVL